MNGYDGDYVDALPVSNNAGNEIVASTGAMAQGGSLLNIAALMTVARKNDFRRDIKRALKDAEAIVTTNANVAKTCFYALPARKGGDGKKIMGPSIGMAETLFSAWGNMVVSLDNVEEHEFEVIVRGWIIDTQNGAGTQDFVRRNIRKANGDRYSHDMVQTTIAAARSVLFRNLVLRMVPRPIVRQLFDAATNVAMGDGVSFEERQKKAVAHWIKLGVPQERLLHHLGHLRISEIGVEDMEYLIGLEQAIKLGDTTVEEAFNPKPEPEESPTTGKLDALAAKVKGKVTTPAGMKGVPDPAETTAAAPSAGATAKTAAPKGEDTPERSEGSVGGREPGADDDMGDEPPFEPDNYVEDEEEPPVPAPNGPITDAQLAEIKALRKQKDVGPRKMGEILLAVGCEEAKVDALTNAQANDVIAKLKA